MTSIEQRLDPGPQRPMGDAYNGSLTCWVRGSDGFVCREWTVGDPWLCPEHQRELQVEPS